MMKLACKDLNPTTTCGFVAVGSDASETANKMLAHAKMNHANDIKGVSDADVLGMMKSKVHK